MRIAEPTVRRVGFEELLKTDGYLVYTVVGISMLPLLRQGRDIVEIRPLHGRARKRDVVFYRRGNRFILHRVRKVLPQGYIIAGDHNQLEEKDVTDSMILGVMTRVIRNGKSIPTTDRRYRLYAWLWSAFWPLSPKAMHAAGRLRAALRRRLHPGGKP